MERLLIAVAVASGAVAFCLWRLGRLKMELARSPEELLIGPQTGHYTGMIRGIIATKTYGVIALTNRRLVFRPPIGRDLDIPLAQIAEISENEWFAGNYRGGREYLILKLADGSERAFQVKDHEAWMHTLQSRLSPT